MKTNTMAAVLSATVALASGCGGGGGGETPTPLTPPTYAVTGGVSGLAGAAVLGLSVDGGTPNTLSVTTDGAFDFPRTLASGRNYAVTVQSQPAAQNCRVSNGSGVIASADITNVSVVCTPATSSVGGSVSGLNGTVVLAITAGGVSGTPLTLTSNGSFTFSQLVASGLSYTVSVQTQPAAQNCTPTNATGVIASTNVTDVLIVCSAAPFSVGGTVSGLNGTVVLGIRAGGVRGTPLTLTSNGAFTFSQQVASGLGYSVSVQSQPAGQGCTVSNGRGVIGTANVGDVSVACTPGPSAPAVSATPGNAQASLAWTADSNATSYNVYISPTSPVTTASPKINVATAGATLPGLVNGTPAFAAVTAVGAAGESPLSNQACAVPTAASRVGTLYDPLCESTFDGTKWQTPLFSRGVVNGAMVLSSQMANMERFNSRGLNYSTVVAVNDGGQRVTTLQASVTVPAASASRTGGAEIRANLTLAYQPPAGRLYPNDQSDLLRLQVGLRDDGSGLRAFRELTHCDNARCTATSSSGITLTDPAGFSGEAPASYDTTYVMTVALNEGSGVLAWTITGGGLNLSGTADPAAYLAGNANWAALGPNPLPSAGLPIAGARTRVLDTASGSSGAISARFDDFKVGFNNLAATPWDDFSGTGGNSGPTELSAAKWATNPGMSSMTLTAGSLVGHAQATTPSAAFLPVFHSLVFSDSSAITTMQADFTISACSNSLGFTNRVGFAAAIYNDGTPGTTPPDVNQPGSRVGDITASLFLDCTFGDVRFQVTRFDTNGSQTVISEASNPLVLKGPGSVIGTTHTLRMKWDPIAHLLTFQADGQAALVVDPTTANARMRIAAPYVKSPNVPNTNLSWFLSLPTTASGGATASVDFKVNNVFTAP